MTDRSRIEMTADVSGGSTSIMAGRDVIITYGSPPTEQFEDDPVGECPYPGLASFGPDQAGWFFGRDRVLGALRVRLDRARAEGGPVVLIGGSGAGKSSLLRCGLIDSVTANGYGDAGSRTWPHVVCTPTDAPVAALAAALAPLVGAPADRLAAEWRDDPANCVATLRGALGSQRVLLVVDQFEELFAGGDGDAVFVDLLDHLCTGVDAPAMVVLGLRADYYGHCLTHPWLAAALRDEPIQLGPLSRAELELVVLGPAAQVGLSVQPALVQVLLADMGSTALPGEDGAGRLPLLAHGLRATWLKRTGKTLTLDGYRDTGGIQGAIATTADRTFGKLSDAGRQAARSVFLRLVRIGVDTEDTRRRVALDDLVDDLPEPAAARAVVAAYTAQRLLTVDRDGVTITHEALLRAWGTLRAWIEADRAGHLFRQELDAHVLAWQAGMRGLHQGATLHNAELWARRHPQDVSPAIARFLAASRRTVNRRRRAWQAATAVVLVLALVAAGAAVYAFNQRDQANAQRATAVARLVAAEAQSLAVSQPGLAKQLALIAARLSGNTGDGVLLAAAESPGTFDSQDSILDVAQTRDGRTLALSTSSGIAMWSTAGHADARITGVTAVGPVALSPNGRVLATVVRDGLNSAVWLWSVADPARPQPLATLPVAGGDAESVAVSATSTVLAVGTATGAIRLWNIVDPAAPRALPALSGHPGGVDSLAFDPVAPVLASSGADHQVRLWSTAAPGLLSTVDGYHGGDDNTNGVVPNYTLVHHRIAFSPNGTMLAAPGDGTNSDLRLWGVHDPARPQLLAAPGNADAVTLNSNSGCDQSIRSVAFAWDGKLLATVCNSTTSLWQADDISKVTVAYTFPINEQSGPAFFTPDKYRMLDATHAGLQDWDVSNPELPGAPANIDQGATGPDAAVAFSGGQRKLFAAVGANIGMIWNLGPRPEVIATLPGLRGVAGIAFRPDGNVIADGENTDDGQGLVLRLRDTTKPGAPMLATMALQLQNGVQSLAFSPDGHTLAMADGADEPSVKLFDVTDPSRPRLIATRPADALHVGFSPDGHLLVANTPDALLSWNVSNPRHPVALPTEQLDISANVSASAFSPDGQILAAGSDSGRVRLWRVNGDRLIGSPTTFEAPGFAGGIAFSPDSRTVALADNGNIPGSTGAKYVQFWDVANPTGPILQAQFSVGDTLAGDSLAFSADGKDFAIDVNGVVLWNTNPSAATVCGSIGDVITPDQWARYVQDEPYDPPCGS